MLALKTARFVKSSKGKSGGYALASAAGEIPIAAVVRLIDGALAPTESSAVSTTSPLPSKKSPKVIGLMKQIRDYVAMYSKKPRLPTCSEPYAAISGRAGMFNAVRQPPAEP
jgi:DNA-binding IscR family transcriptional regulator